MFAQCDPLTITATCCATLKMWIIVSIVSERLLLLDLTKFSKHTFTIVVIRIQLN